MTVPTFQYLQKCETFFQEHKVYSNSRGIYISAGYPPSSGFIEKLQKLDNERKKYIKNIEKKCRNRRMGGGNISLGVIVWKKRRGVWNSFIICHKGVWLNRAIIRRREQACGIQRPLSITLTESKREYKICRDEFEILKPDVDICMERFLARRVKGEIASGNIKKSK